MRSFVDEGPKMALLISDVLEVQQRGQLYPPDRVSAHYLRKLRAALEQEGPDLASPSAELPEPLSERELEVLTLVAAGKSNQEMAGELFVAKSTVKTHIKNIYRKLDTHNRTQALGAGEGIEPDLVTRERQTGASHLRHHRLDYRREVHDRATPPTSSASTPSSTCTGGAREPSL